MLFRKFAVPSIIAGFFLFSPATLLAHHMAPDELQDFITDQLTDVDSPHLLSSDDDPSLSETTVEGIDDIDYVVIVENLSGNEVTEVLEDVLDQLSSEIVVCDVKYVIDYDSNTMTFTLTVYVDYCSQ
jgi:hypothetical protein